MDLRSEGYDKLAEDAENAFNKLTEDVRRNTDTQNLVIAEMLQLVSANYDATYAHIQQVLEKHGMVVSDTTDQVIKDTKLTLTDYYGDVVGKFGTTTKEIVKNAEQQATALSSVFGKYAEDVDVLTDKIGASVVGISSKLDAEAKKLAELLNGINNIPEIQNPNASQDVDGEYRNAEEDINKLVDGSAKNDDGNTETNKKTMPPPVFYAEVTDPLIGTGNGRITGVLNDTLVDRFVVNAKKTNKDPAQSQAEQAKAAEEERENLRRIADNFIAVSGKAGNKTTYNNKKYGDFNMALYKKTGKVLEANQRQALASMLHISYNNDSTSGNLYKKLKEIGFFAKGSNYIPNNQLGWTNEKGQEIHYRRSDGAILTPLGKGDKVFTADMADNLWKLSQMNTEAIEKNIADKNSINNITNKPTITLTFDSLIHVDGNIDKNAVDDMRRIANDAVNAFSKQLTTDFGLFGNKLRF